MFRDYPFLAFYRGAGDWRDALIRRVSGSPYSHVEFLPEGIKADTNLGVLADAVSASLRDGGVRARQIHFKQEKWDLVPLFFAPSIAAEMLTPELGKKYDFLGAVRTAVPFLSKPNPSRWFCSQLCAYALGVSKAERVAPDQLKRIVCAMNAAYRSGFRHAS